MKFKDCKGVGSFLKGEVEVMMYEVALVVEWLYNHGIVHRDLKASNVIICGSKSGWVKVGAFCDRL